MNNTINMFSNGYPFPYPKRSQFPSCSALLSNMTESGNNWRIIDPIAADGSYVENKLNILVYKSAGGNVLWSSENVWLSKGAYYSTALFFLGESIFAFVGKKLVKVNRATGVITYGQEITHPDENYTYAAYSFCYIGNQLKIKVTERLATNGDLVTYCYFDVNTDALTINNKIPTPINGEASLIIANGQVSVHSLNTPSFSSGYTSSIGAPTFRLKVNVAVDDKNVYLPLAITQSTELPLFHRGEQISPNTLMLGISKEGSNPNLVYQDALYWDYDSFNEWVINIIKHHMGYDFGTIN
ncbi:hypothetical protein [Pseudoalteromonas sp. M8]|uniref:hypothetical protein n=1 Tax=Pseudoalteromonas sp. M8 TaxID=2692624 RepID=UPI001BAAA69D|nr:hypothetical protein [Pseudoalteromonas sp. M8]QUI71246.1 hypothetical protein GSF13_16475 [Pseudoalteromonas sp. M8]